MTKYQATIHTAKIEIPWMPVGSRYTQWLYKKNFPFVNKIENTKDGYGVILNLHRMPEKALGDGRYHFEYEPLREYEQDMETVCKMLDIPAYTLKRLDICLDTQTPYRKTEKLTRYIALALRRSIPGWTNENHMWQSVNPRTGEHLTLRLQKNDRRSKSLEIEHYNRITVDQSKYDYTVENRFELRAMSGYAGKNNTPRTIAERWLKWFGGLSEERFREVEQNATDTLLSEWNRRTARGFESSSTAFNYYLANNDGMIYTSRQLTDLFEQCGKTKEAAKSFRQRSGKGIVLFKGKQVQEEVSAMREAMKIFLK